MVLKIWKIKKSESMNREGAKLSALSSGEIDKYEHLTGEEILPSNQSQITEQAKFTYSPLGNALEKQTKTIEDQGEKWIKAIENRIEKQKWIEKQILNTDQKSMSHLLSKDFLAAEARDELNKIKETEQEISRDDL